MNGHRAYREIAQLIAIAGLLAMAAGAPSAQPLAYNFGGTSCPDQGNRADVECTLEGNTLTVEYAGGRVLELKGNWVQDGVTYRASSFQSFELGDKKVPLPVPGGELVVNCSVFSIGVELNDGMPNIEDALNEHLDGSSVELQLPSNTIAAGFDWGDNLIAQGVKGPINPCEGYVYFYFDSSSGIQLKQDGVSLDLSQDEMLVVLVDPADPAFYIGIKSDMLGGAADYVSGMGFGFSARGKLRWQSAVKLWEGGASTHRDAFGHLFTNSSLALKPIPKFPIALKADSEMILGVGNLGEVTAKAIQDAVNGKREKGESFDFRDFQNFFDELTLGYNVRNLTVELGNVLNIQIGSGSVLLQDGVVFFGSCVQVGGNCTGGEIPQVEIHDDGSGESEVADLFATLWETFNNVDLQPVVQGYVDLTPGNLEPRFGIRLKVDISFGVGNCVFQNVWLRVDHTGVHLDVPDNGPVECDFEAYIEDVKNMMCDAANAGLDACVDELETACSEIEVGQTCQQCEADCHAKYGNKPTNVPLGICLAFKCGLACGTYDGLVTLGTKLCGTAHKFCHRAAAFCADDYPEAGAYPPAAVELDPVEMAEELGLEWNGTELLDPAVPAPVEPPPNYLCKRVVGPKHLWRICEEPLTHAEATASCEAAGGILAGSGNKKWREYLAERNFTGEALWMHSQNGCKTLLINGQAATTNCDEKRGAVCLLAKTTREVGQAQCRIHDVGTQRLVHCDSGMSAFHARGKCAQLGGHLIHLDDESTDAAAQVVLAGKDQTDAWIGLRAPVSYDFHWHSDRNGFRPIQGNDAFAAGERDRIHPLHDRVAYTKQPAFGLTPDSTLIWWAEASQSGAKKAALCRLHTSDDGWAFTLPTEQIDVDFSKLSVAGDDFGAALATGDFNGDGYDDLAVGAPRDYTDWFNASGSATVLMGGAFGLSSGQFVRSDEPVDGAEFGDTLGAWDVNGDGRDELIVGHHQRQVLEVFAWNTDGSFAWIDSVVAADCLEPGALSHPMDRASVSSFVVADLDSDGHDEMLAAIQVESLGGTFSTKLAVLRGTQGTGSIVHWVNHDLDGRSAGPYLAAGDLNADGKLDVVAAGQPSTADFDESRLLRAFVTSTSEPYLMVDNIPTGAGFDYASNAYRGVAITGGRVVTTESTETLGHIVSVWEWQPVESAPCFGAFCPPPSGGSGSGWGSGGASNSSGGALGLVAELDSNLGFFGAAIAGRGASWMVAAPVSNQVFIGDVFTPSDMQAFTPAGAAPGAAVGSALALADFDNDGTLDAVAGAPSHDGGRVFSMGMEIAQEF